MRTAIDVRLNGSLPVGRRDTLNFVTGTGIRLDVTNNYAEERVDVRVGVDDTALLSNNARVAVRKNSGSTVGTRRKLNFIEGTNVTLTVADDAANEEVDVTIAASGGGSVSATTVEADLGAAAFAGKFTITDAAISGTSKVLCWQAPGPYTGKGTRADEAAMQQVLVVAVEPLAGSAVVHWQTPPMVTSRREPDDGRRNAAGATFDRLDNQRWPDEFIPTRLGKVKGNVKFTYMVI